MSKAFDPYHVWLGIPPAEQPANHYRLLGIALFEGDVDVIATSADRQMGHLRTFQSGKHSELSQRLLNEIAAAKICLLTPAKKAAYDEQLRRSQSTAAQAVSAASEGTQKVPCPIFPAQKFGTVPNLCPTAADSSQWAEITGYAPSLGRTRHAAKKRPINLGSLIAVVVAGVLVLAGLLVWNAARQTDKPTVVAVAGKNETVSRPVNQPSPAKPKEDAPQPLDKTDSPPIVQSRPEKPAADVEPVAANPPIAAKPPEKPAAGKDEIAESPTSPTFEKPAKTGEKPAGSAEKPADSPENLAMPSFDDPAGKPDKPESNPVGKKRLPVPDEGIQEKIAAQVSSIYNPSRAKTPAERIKLAYQLLQAAKASKEPNEQYVLLSRVRELAVQAGEIALVLQVVEAMGEFDINPLEEKSKALLAFAEKASSADQIRSLYGVSQRVIAQALSESRFELAADLGNGVCRACQRPQAKEFRKKSIAQRDWVQAYCRRQAERQEAEAKLKANPDDGDAHLLLGRYCCLDDDWRKGLPHLAKCSDAALRQLAEQDIASPNEAAGQIALADAWWALGKSRKAEERDLLLLRAGYWYERAAAD